MENLALACPSCNSHKWMFTEGTDPDSGRMIPLFNPRTQVWSEHFSWSQEHPFELQGQTATGRATIHRLQMNAPDLVTIRRLLSELGHA